MQSTVSTTMRNLTIVHRSDNFLVVDKPPDLIINSDDPDRDSVYLRLQRQFPDLADISKYKHGFPVLHRLDFATSGLLVVPLNKRAARSASRAFERRLTKKFYAAILRGRVEAEAGDLDLVTVDWAVGEDSEGDPGVRMCLEDDGVKEKCLRPRNAVTNVVVLSRGTFGSVEATKVLLNPVTGRRHQLRVHCANALDNAIVGDYTYTGESDTDRMYLDAHRIVVPNDLEDLDVERSIGGEPFCDVREYTEVSKVRSLSEAYRLLEDLSAAQCGWKLVTKPDLLT